MENNLYKQAFTDAMDNLFPSWREYESSGLLDRYMDDNKENGIPYQKVLDACSLAELKAMASIIKMKHDLHHALRSGSCYQDDSRAREELGCPRLYAQCANDEAALEAFSCAGVFHIPSCPKFASGECWKRFDELGLFIR